MNLKERATFVAKTFRLGAARDRAGMVTEAYKKAYPYVWEEKIGQKVKFEDSLCYKELSRLELYDKKEISKEDADEIFLIARKRFWKAASGNVTILALKNETNWLAVDLPLILENTAIRRINGENKFDFAKKYTA